MRRNDVADDAGRQASALKRLLPPLALLAIAVLLLRDSEGTPPTQPIAGPTKARVIRVVDGDTIAVSIAGRTEKVRYIGIDTPETVKPNTPVQCFGKAASNFNKSLVANRQVTLRFDRERRDRYGRLLAYVYTGNRLINAELIRRGYATTLTIEPNTAKATQLARLEAQASRQGRGLWSRCEGS